MPRKIKNNQSFIFGALIMNTTDTTSLTGRYLNLKDLPQVMKLQDTIADGLAEAGTPRHIVKRSEEYFLEHLSTPHAMYGMINEKGQIAAQSIFRISDVDTVKELCVDSLPDLKDHDKLSVAQGILVHPDYQGLGLMQCMLGQWFEWCKDNDVRHLAARTQSSHNLSQKGFLKNNFNRVATVIDPKDNAEVCVLHRTLNAEKTCLKEEPSTENLHGLEGFVIDLTCS